MGQEPPGMVPLLFAKGIVSTAIGMYGTVVSSPDLHEAFWKPEAPAMCHMREAGDTWGPVREFPFNPEDAGLDSPCYSPDGRRLFFLYLPFDESGHTGNGQIWYAEKKGDDWNVVGELDPTVDSVEKHFQFSVDRGGNLYFSNTDIYCARYDYGVYEAPEKLP